MDATIYADDWQYIEEVETLTYTSPAGVATTGVKGLRSELSFREVTAGAPAGIEPTDLVLELWVSTLPAGGPASGGTLTDADGNVYTIQSFTGQMIGRTVIRYRAIVRKQA